MFAAVINKPIPWWHHFAFNWFDVALVLVLRAGAAVPVRGRGVGEGVLPFLGPGARPPTPSWGVMPQDAQSSLSQAPRLAVYPGLAIVLAALAFNVLGDGLRDILDPRTTR